jgi:hypothetical protein
MAAVADRIYDAKLQSPGVHVVVLPAAAVHAVDILSPSEAHGQDLSPPAILFLLSGRLPVLNRQHFAPALNV